MQRDYQLDHSQVGHSSLSSLRTLSVKKEGESASPAPGVGVRGNSDPGAQSGCADSHVSGCDTAIALTVTDHGHAETRLCTRVFPCAPRACTGALCNPGKDVGGGGAYCKRARLGAESRCTWGTGVELFPQIKTPWKIVLHPVSERIIKRPRKEY